MTWDKQKGNKEYSSPKSVSNHNSLPWLRPRTPSRLKNEMTRPTTDHEVLLVKPEISDLQRTPNDRNLHGAFEPP